LPATPSTATLAILLATLAAASACREADEGCTMDRCKLITITEPLCVDTRIDPEHCGGCWRDCRPGLCVDGACQCRTGGTLCLPTRCLPPPDITGCGSATRLCVDLATDPVNCGACGNVCPAGVGCSAGRCQ
jgi:hypothetical protein